MPVSGKANFMGGRAAPWSRSSGWCCKVVFDRNEVEVAGVDAVRRDERTRPVDAPAAGTDELGTFAAAGGRQEDGVAVRAIYLLELR